jgi:hypothetical protein
MLISKGSKDPTPRRKDAKKDMWMSKTNSMQTKTWFKDFCFPYSFFAFWRLCVDPGFGRVRPQ